MKLSEPIGKVVVEFQLASRASGAKGMQRPCFPGAGLKYG